MHISCSALIAITILVLPQAADARDFTGVWVAHKLGFIGDALGINAKYGVEFKNNGDTLCGVLSWLRPPLNTTLRDAENADARSG